MADLEISKETICSVKNYRFGFISLHLFDNNGLISTQV